MIDIGPPPSADLVVEADDDAIEFYRQNGYLVCDRLTTDEELAWLNDVYDALLALPRTGFVDGAFDLMSPYGTMEPPKLGQMLMPEKRVPALRETALWKNARRIARRLIDVPDAEVENWGHIIYKAPECDNVTPWHQDEAYWDVNFSFQAVGCWSPLQNVDETNGCLWFLPGSHKGEVMRHRHYGDDPAVHVLEVVAAVDTSAAVPVPLPAGAASFHHPRMLHHAGPNLSPCIRKAWANEFQSKPRKRQQPADHPWVKEGHDAMVERYARRKTDGAD